MNKIIEGLKNRLATSVDGYIHIQEINGDFEGYYCSFSPPADNNEINRLESEIDNKLPLDYRAFLETCNGCSLFDHPLYGGENKLYSISEVLNLHHSREDSRHLLKVAYIFQDHIVIDLNKVRSGEEDYLFVKQFASIYRPGGHLHCNFETWLYRFASTNGAKYWDWRID